MKDVSARYRTLESLGHGGMGEVYLARDLMLDRKVALKILHTGDRLLKDSRVRVIREAKAAAALDHPYICKVYEVLHADDADCIVMEYLEGTTLRTVLAGGPVNIRDAIIYACEIAEALDYAHSKGVIHRDLKPANIMLTSARHIKILDFGLAKRLPVAQDGETPNISTHADLSRMSIGVGTPIYMSPEQVKSKPTDCRSDIFSFGIVLYEMLTGVHPFLKPDLDGTTRAIVNENPPSLSTQGHVPQLLAHVLRKMLAKAPEARYQSAHEIFTDLQELREPDPDSWSSTLPPGAARRRSRWLMLGMGVLLLLLLALGLWQLGRRQTEEPPPTEEVLIDWPSLETEARISPDGQWFSFLSLSQGRTTLWKKNMMAPAPEMIEIQGTPSSHAWSGDGQRIACLARDGSSWQVEFVPVFYRDKPQIYMNLDELQEDARTDLLKSTPAIVAWIGDRLYLEGSGSIWVIDVRTRAVRQVADKVASAMNKISIRNDEKKVVYGKQDEIWMADLDGGNPQKLTDNQWRDYGPRWINVNGEWRVIYSSNQRGQLDLYWLDPDRPSPRWLLSRGQEEIRVQDCSLDGSRVLSQVIKDEANLWCYDPLKDNRVPATSGTLSDFAPTLAPGSGRLAFQRIKQKLVQGSRLVDTEIFSANVEKLPIENPQRILQDGSAPHLSPDGRWLAYLIHKPRKINVELRLKDLSTQKEWALTENARVQISDVPMQWMYDLSWSEDSSQLFFAETIEGSGTSLKVCAPPTRTGEPPACRQLIGSAPETLLSNPIPDHDGKSLAYCLRKRGSPSTWEIHRLVLASHQDRLLFPDSGFQGTYYCLGWQPDSSLIVLRSFPPDWRGDSSGKLEILKIQGDGSSTRIGELARAYGQTATLDLTGQTLYVTSLENDISNIVARNLSSGEMRRLTDNQRADTTFGGLQAGPAGRLFYSQERYASDIYLLRFESK